MMVMHWVIWQNINTLWGHKTVHVIRFMSLLQYTVFRNWDLPVARFFQFGQNSVQQFELSSGSIYVWTSHNVSWEPCMFGIAFLDVL